MNNKPMLYRKPALKTMVNKLPAPKPAAHVKYAPAKAPTNVKLLRKPLAAKNVKYVKA